MKGVNSLPVIKNLKETDRLKEKFFVSIVVLVLLSLIYGKVVQAKQNKEYLKDAQMYYTLQENLSKENPDTAIKKINYLQSKDKNNYLLFLDKATVYKNEKKYKLAKSQYEKAFKKRPLLLQDIKYVYLYGEILYLNNDYKEAIDYLLKVNEMQPENEYKQSIDSMMYEMLQKMK